MYHLALSTVRSTIKHDTWTQVMKEIAQHCKLLFEGKYAIIVTVIL